MNLTTTPSNNLTDSVLVDSDIYAHNNGNDVDIGISVAIGFGVVIIIVICIIIIALLVYLYSRKISQPTPLAPTEPPFGSTLTLPRLDINSTYGRASPVTSRDLKPKKLENVTNGYPHVYANTARFNRSLPTSHNSNINNGINANWRDPLPSSIDYSDIYHNAHDYNDLRNSVLISTVFS